jgi:hypothetical protein
MTAMEIRTALTRTFVHGTNVPLAEIRTVGELKVAIKYARQVNVFVVWNHDDGDYVEVKKATILRDLCIDTPSDGAHGGRDNGTAVKAHIQDGAVFIG